MNAPRLVTAAELQRKAFEPVRWVVPGLIPEGLTIIASRPKLGKSWLMLDLCNATAIGGWTLGDRHCQAGAVLYAALEDGERRLKDRLGKICHQQAWPRGLSFVTEMPNLTAGGLEFLRGWAKSAEGPRLMVIDTFAKVRPTKGREETQYEADYHAAGILKALADELRIGIIMVHHVRKMEAEDPFDMVSGTNGLTGAADTIFVMKRESGAVTLYGRGRDIEEVELAMEFQRDICRWRVLGAATEVHSSGERKAIRDALREAGEPLKIADIAAITGHPQAATKKLLFRMYRAGELRRNQRGSYSLPDRATP